jgi:hypothetical protein
MNEAKLVTRIFKRIFRKIIKPKVLVSLFLAGIMVFSILGFMMSYQMEDNTIEREYNGHKFTQLYDGIQTEINDQKISLNYFPEQLESINISSAVKVVLASSEVIAITYDGDSEYKEFFAEQQFELNNKLEKIDKYVMPGIIDNTDVEQITQLDCSNATSSVPVILFQEGLSTNITFNNNCVIVNIGNINDAYRVGDLLFYHMAGIME